MIEYKKSDAVIGIKFPTIIARALSGNQIIIPDSAHGYISLILIAFRRHAQTMIDSWLTPYEKEFGENPAYTFYEIPMIAERWARIFARIIDGGMKGGIPLKKHANVATYYGPIKKYQEILSMDDINLGYAFLIDKKGMVKWKGQGLADSKHIQELLQIAKEVLEK
jgi:hypothetical protein